MLQEQSEIPSHESERQSTMYPSSRDLVAMVRRAGSEPMFFLTWAHRNGWPANGLPDYFAMQSAIDDAYLFISREQRAPVAPVGEAWASLYSQESRPDLWQDDGSHPTAKGTYLAACVFYAAIFRQSPAGLQYRPFFLSDGDAALAQRVAASTVLDDRSRWGLT